VNITSAILGPCPSNTGGVPRLNITGMCFDDGPAGPRYTDFVTQFPSAFFAAASFDRDLMYERAVRIGNEFRGKGINVALAPVTGGPLGRSPYAGRNWEAFSPDPYLSATMSGITVRGMQSSGLITCAKHYVLYEQEPVCTGPLDWTGGRTDCRDVSSNVDGAYGVERGLSSQTRRSRSSTCLVSWRASELGPAL
jgi:beta-glucosidase